MAMTAKATEEGIKSIVDTKEPNETNMCYWVKQGVSVHDFVTLLVAKLKVQISKCLE